MPQITCIFEAVALVKAIAAANGAEANVNIYFNTGEALSLAPHPAPTKVDPAGQAEEVEEVEEESAAEKKKRLANEKRAATRAKKKLEAEAAKKAEAEAEEVEEEDEDEDEDEEGVTLEDAQQAMLAACENNSNLEVRALVNTFGVKKVSEMSAEQRADFVAQLAEEFPA